MAKFSQYVIQVGAIVVGGILTVATAGAAAGTFAAALGKAGVGLLVTGGLGIVTGLISSRGQSGVKDSPTYAGIAVSNHRGDGEPIPYVYGEMQQTPLAIHTGLTSEDTADVVERVYLLGWSPMQVFNPTVLEKILWSNTPGRKWGSDLIDRITLNDVPLKEIDSQAAAFIHETVAGGDLGKLPGFNRTGRPYAQTGTKLNKDVEHLYTMKAVADEIHIVFDWPGGILKIDTGGNQHLAAGGVRFEYRLIGTATWKKADLGATVKTTKVLFKTVTTYEKSKDNPDWVPVVPEENITSFVEGEYWVAGKTRGRVRKIAKIELPERGRYEIRLTGLVDDDTNDTRAPTVSTMIEVDQKPVTSVIGVTLLAIKFKATEQLRGSEPILKIRSLGRIIAKLEDSMNEGWSDNAASCLYDFLSHEEGSVGLWYGAGTIDDGASGTWRDVANTLDTNTFEYVPKAGGEKITEKIGRCNMIVDSVAPASDWAERFMSLFQGAFFEAEGLLMLARDEIRSADRVFESRPPPQSFRYNILARPDGQTTLDVTETEESERYNAVVVEYVDREENWTQRKTPPIKLDDAVGVTKPARYLRVFLPGVTSESQARQIGSYLVQRAQYSTRLLRWGISWGDHDSLPWDRVTVKAEGKGFTTDSLDVNILGIAYSGNGQGVIVGREYTADQTIALLTQPRNKSNKPIDDPLDRLKRIRDAAKSHGNKNDPNAKKGGSGASGAPQVTMAELKANNILPSRNRFGNG